MMLILILMREEQGISMMMLILIWLIRAGDFDPDAHFDFGTKSKGFPS